MNPPIARSISTLMAMGLPATLGKAIRYGAKHQESLNYHKPIYLARQRPAGRRNQIPPCDQWGTLQHLNKKRSGGDLPLGTPLDDLSVKCSIFSAPLTVLNDLDPLINRS